MSFTWNLAWRNVQRGGRWAALAIFCIATGVASVVALRSLGLAIRDSLVENVRVDLKGDLRFSKRSVSQFANFFVDDERARRFSPRELAAVRAWVEERGGTMSAFAIGGTRQIAAVDSVSFGRPSFISTLYIDPASYPPTGPILALDPPGVPLADLFQRPNSVVISDNMARNQGLRLGDTVRVSGTEALFTVTGIVATENEAGIRDLFAAFFGFAYFSLSDAQAAINANIRPDNLAVAFPAPLSREEEFQAVEALRRLGFSEGGSVRYDTLSAALERNRVIAQVLGDFIVIMGLGALLIGGVGIMNTLLVLVRRRTEEIAALKTIGLQPRQIAALFLTEGLLLGALGTAAGCAAGALLGGLVNRYGEVFLQQALPWRVYSEALAYGAVLGLVTSAAFSVAPILMALQVRPAIILRPNEARLPRLGCLQTAFLSVFLTLVAGLLVGGVVSPTFALANSFNPLVPYLSGLVGVAISFVVLALLVAILWVIVWLVGKLPSFGWVDLRLALRNLSTQRLRTATTLLALSAGMFALSSITFVGEGTREILNLQLARQVGGNVLVFPIALGSLGASLSDFALRAALNGVPGVEARNRLSAYEGRLLRVDGQDVDMLVAQSGDAEALAQFVLGGLSQWNTDNPRLYETLAPVSQGRTLRLEDRGQPVLVAPLEFARVLGARVGSVLEYSIQGQRLRFEIVGLTGNEQLGGAAFLSSGLAGVSVVVPPDSLGSAQPLYTLYTYQVAPEHVNQALVSLSAVRIPPIIALDVSFIDTLISRLIAQFSAIPTLVGLLSLVAAAVIMANTVALATLERQKQIGVLRAIGLSARRSLGVLLLEASLIGLLSALLGIGLSALGVALMTGLGGTPIPLPTDARLAALALLVSALLIALFATLLSASGALCARVMDVLRYE
ncbi:MAG: ABC transporter permease [Anaerolineae bacterium]|nr:ABC transporter permease [Anaerolineae bacterium]MDW8172963.1 FtsX-like permease family protein [Anaerolineae bacterium]